MIFHNDLSIVKTTQDGKCRLVVKFPSHELHCSMVGMMSCTLLNDRISCAFKVVFVTVVTFIHTEGYLLANLLVECIFLML